MRNKYISVTMSKKNTKSQSTNVLRRQCVPSSLTRVRRKFKTVFPISNTTSYHAAGTAHTQAALQHTDRLFLIFSVSFTINHAIHIHFSLCWSRIFPSSPSSSLLQESFVQLSQNLITHHTIFGVFHWLRRNYCKCNKWCLKFMLLYRRLLITGQVIWLSTTSQKSKKCV